MQPDSFVEGYLMRKISILLVDDHKLMLQGLRALLLAEPDIEILGEAENGREAVRMTAKLNPDIVVMDIAMPQLNGLEATRQIRKKMPLAKVLVLSSYGEIEYVRQLIDAGAVGYLTKETLANDLITGIRNVQKGNTYFSSSIAKMLQAWDRKSFLETGKQLFDQKSIIKLTSREREVLQLVAEGKSNKLMALEIGISIKTVEKHRQQVMDKLNIHDVAGLTRYAIAQGVVESPIRLV
jgi:DNA-binding NarL/FixJ family response regulator